MANDPDWHYDELFRRQPKAPDPARESMSICVVWLLLIGIGGGMVGGWLCLAQILWRLL